MRFKILSKNELYVVMGKSFFKNEIKKKKIKTNVKTIDFEWEFKNKKFYAYHKYTKESGGTQGSQYVDLKIFIENANLNKDKNIYYLVIADGIFYDTQNGNVGVSKIENLKDISNNKNNVFAMRIEELKDLLK